jgi:hypothetical protein
MMDCWKRQPKNFSNVFLAHNLYGGIVRKKGLCFRRRDRNKATRLLKIQQLSTRAVQETTHPWRVFGNIAKGRGFKKTKKRRKKKKQPPLSSNNNILGK